ncbi:MAG TPA: ABC transporter substrate-binding protein [Gaiellaceae bacterium]|nr:ABC transporter substrate-binding protein [Gaiellaceae bacterium]
MRRSTLPFLAVVVAVVSGCGASSQAAPPPATTGASIRAPAASTTSFPLFRVAQDASIDYLDPGLTYSSEGLNVIWNVYLPLLGYRHVAGADGATIVPYLARSLPSVSKDGRTYTLTLRRGLRYSNGQPVKASDFKATVERDFKLDSPGTGYFDNIVGADQLRKARDGHISGIVADDATGRIAITLKSPQGDFENVLASEFAAPVPANASASDTSTHPLPATGPYMIQSYSAGKQIVEVRNPHFRASLFKGEVPAGNPDKVVWDIVGDPAAALQRTIAGQDDWDPQAIPGASLAATDAKYGGQIKVYTPPNTYYFFMNTRVKPFNNVLVRRAVNYAIDRKALVAIYGGLGRATENILPPSYPSYSKHSLYPHDLAKARKLIRQAHAVGARVRVWNHDRGVDPKATEYLVKVLNSIGLNARPKIVTSATYWATIGNQASAAQIGFADWFQDYPHPLDWFDILLNGERITKTYNSNYSNFDDKGVNKKIDALNKQPVPTSPVNSQWAALDRRIMLQAPWAPFLNREFTDFFNQKVDLGCYVNHVVYGFDYATICMR